MKKLSICLLLVMCLFMTGCGKDKVKVAVTIDEFETVLVNKTFSVDSNMTTYENVDYISDSKRAVLNNIEIEMVVYTDSKYAEQVHEGQIESFNLLKNTGAYEENIKGDNYYRYALVSNGRYMVSTRVDDTLIFCKTMLENKETVEAIYEELGY